MPVPHPGGMGDPGKESVVTGGDNAIFLRTGGNQHTPDVESLTA